MFFKVLGIFFVLNKDNPDRYGFLYENAAVFNEFHSLDYFCFFLLMIYFLLGYFDLFPLLLNNLLILIGHLASHSNMQLTTCTCPTVCGRMTSV